MWNEIDGWFGPGAVNEYCRIAQKYPGGNFAEVGIWKGRSFAGVLQTLLEHNYQNIYAIDHWLGQEDLRNADHREASQINLYEVFVQNMSRLGYDGKYKVLTMDSVTAAAQFSDHFFDVVFIDSDHSYEAFCRDLDAWVPKIKFGGTLCGHDYPEWPGVKRGLEERFGTRFAGLPDSMWEMVL